MAQKSRESQPQRSFANHNAHSVSPFANTTASLLGNQFAVTDRIETQEVTLYATTPREYRQPRGTPSPKYPPRDIIIRLPPRQQEALPTMLNRCKPYDIVEPSSAPRFRFYLPGISGIQKKYPVKENMSDLPMETILHLFKFLDQATLHNFIRTNSKLRDLAAEHLYMTPEFASTYRFAQFVDIIRSRPYYAMKVRVLDLSHFAESIDREGELLYLAGWREWKYREHDMFHGNPELHRTYRGYLSGKNYGTRGRYRKGRKWDPATGNLTTLRKLNKNGLTSHPPPSPLLKSFHKVRDVPIGTICIVLAACQNIRKVDLSRLHLASDFLVISPACRKPTPEHLRPNFKEPEPYVLPVMGLPIITNPALWPDKAATEQDPQDPSMFSMPPTLPFEACANMDTILTHDSIYHAKQHHDPEPISPLTNFTFTSLLPTTPLYSTSNTQLLPMYGDELVFWMTQLGDLQEVVLKGCSWLSTMRIWYLLGKSYRGGERGKGLQKVDFRDSGINAGMKFAVEGTREMAERVLAEMMEDVRSRKVNMAHYGQAAILP